MPDITRAELTAAVLSAMTAHSSQTRTLEREIRLLKTQRDAAKGRCTELRAYVARYQKEIALLKRAV